MDTLYSVFTDGQSLVVLSMSESEEISSVLDSWGGWTICHSPRSTREESLRDLKTLKDEDPSLEIVSTEELMSQYRNWVKTYENQ